MINKKNQVRNKTHSNNKKIMVTSEEEEEMLEKQLNETQFNK